MTAHFRPLITVMSGGPDYPVTGPKLHGVNVHTVTMELVSNGDDPKYSFSGACHRVVDHKDHFFSDDGTYILRFKIKNPKGWSFQADAFRVLSETTAQYYYVDFDPRQPNQFDLNVTKNVNQPNNTEHGFNLYLTEQTPDGAKPRKIDPDVDNPPIGLASH